MERWTPEHEAALLKAGLDKRTYDLARRGFVELHKRFTNGGLALLQEMERINDALDWVNVYELSVAHPSRPINIGHIGFVPT